MTWEEARDAAGARAVAILPVGAVEAHGPHLPLETDVSSRRPWPAPAPPGSGARLPAVVFPPLAYTAAAFAGIRRERSRSAARR